MLLVGMEQRGNVLGEMLSVGIQRNGIGKPHAFRFAETVFQSGSLASVFLADNKGDALHATENVGRTVRATVADHYHVAALPARPAHHIADGSGIVVRRNHHADASRAERISC